MAILKKNNILKDRRFKVYLHQSYPFYQPTDIPHHFVHLWSPTLMQNLRHLTIDE